MRRPVDDERSIDRLMSIALRQSIVVEDLVVGAPEAAKKAAESKAKRRGKNSEKGLDRAIDEARAMFEKGDWSGAEARHLVGLYAIAHRRTYGVDPEELVSAFLPAVSSARKLVVECFSGSVVDAVAFVGWVWSREAKTEKRRRAEGTDSDFRIGWRFMFAQRRLVTDYRVVERREKAR